MALEFVCMFGGTPYIFSLGVFEVEMCGMGILFVVV